MRSLLSSEPTSMAMIVSAPWAAIRSAGEEEEKEEEEEEEETQEKSKNDQRQTDRQTDRQTETDQEGCLRNPHPAAGGHPQGHREEGGSQRVTCLP